MGQYSTPSGRGRKYHPNGLLKVEGTFAYGKAEGFVRIYKNDGVTMIYEGNVSDGQKNGFGKVFNDDGQLVFSGNHQVFASKRSKRLNGIWYDNGSVIFEGAVDQ